MSIWPWLTFQEIVMNNNPMKLTRLSASLVLAFSSFGAYAVENQPTAPVNKDQIDGRVDEAKGAVKEITGKVLDDKGMEIQGNVQKNVGKAQAGFGDLKQDIQKSK
jgi:uncharacterized protein YjbJ (UPF0337 family)